MLHSMFYGAAALQKLPIFTKTLRLHACWNASQKNTCCLQASSYTKGLYTFQSVLHLPSHFTPGTLTLPRGPWLCPWASSFDSEGNDDVDTHARGNPWYRENSSKAFQKFVKTRQNPSSPKALRIATKIEGRQNSSKLVKARRKEFTFRENPSKGIHV